MSLLRGLGAVISAVLAGTALSVVPAPALGGPATAGGDEPAYLQPTATITPAEGCHRLRAGMTGVKVRMVQQRLGLGSRWEVMDAETIAAVKAFQRRRDLPRRTGVVDARTWRAMGFDERFCMDRWQAEVVLPRGAGPARRIRTMLAFANTYRGAEYVWGGAGRPAYGVDCSGLVLQALYRAGLDPQPISIDQHVLADYRTSAELYRHPGLRHVPRGRMRRGDLIFYTKDSTGQVNHVALYLGRGRVIQAKGEQVHRARVRRTYPGQTIAPTVVRPFGRA